MADDEPLLIDVEVRVGNRGVYSTKHFLQSERDLLEDLVEAVLGEYAGTTLDDIVLGGEGSDGGSNPVAVETQALIGRIKSVKCVGKQVELYKFLQRSGVTLKMLNSTATPIFKNGLIIDLATKEARTPKPKANLPSSLNILMGDGEPEQLKFLPPPTDEPDPRMDAQIKARVIALLKSDELELGYFNIGQRTCLEKNVDRVVGVLCFVQKQWKKLLHKDFPRVPLGENSSSLLLQLVGKCNRKKAVNERITMSFLSTHIGTLSGLSWSPFLRSKRLKGPLDLFKDEIEMIRGILLKKKGNMAAANSASSPTAPRSAPSSFESLPSCVKLDDDSNEFFVAIPRSTGASTNPRGRPTAQSRAIDSAIEKLARVLRAKENYTPVFLPDEDMGIVDAAFETEGGERMLDASMRAHQRLQFKKKLAKGLVGININMFGRTRSGINNPTCLFVWKVPLAIGEEHPGKVQRAIETCRKTLPKELGKQAMLHFNNLLKGIAGVPAGVLTAMRNFLFMGEVNPKGVIAHEYCQFVLDVASGIEADMSHIIDGRQFNSRGGNGIGGTMFGEFWSECRSILLPTATTEERRHTDEMHASEVLSIPDLVRRATENLEAKVSSGELEEMPPVPSEEFVSLQFVPNNHTVAAASKFSGLLGVKRAMQTRTLRKQHPDQHWVNAYTRYVLEWLVELHIKSPSSVEFFGQDDKAKIPVGDKVAVSTGVRTNGRAIVDANKSQQLGAMDHDFHYANLTPSVTLRCNIPGEMGGSFFTGGEEGHGQIFVTLRDSIFEPSNVWDHTAQLVDTLDRQSLNPSVFVLQTDGGPDHNLKRLQTKLVLIAFFKDRDMDHFLGMRGAPNGSAHNKIERPMSPLNMALMHTATKRAAMPEWAEDSIKSCTTMNDIREKEKKMRGLREAAVARLAELDEMDRKKAICSMFKLTLNRYMDRFSADCDPSCKVTATKAVDTLMALIGAEGPALDERGAVAAVVEDGKGNQRNIYSTSLLDCIARAKRDEAQRVSSNDFRAAWDASIGVPIKLINERFARLQVGGRPVLVYPRVQSDVEKRLHDILKKLDPQYDPNLNLAEDLKKMPALKAWIDAHCVITPYSISIQRCNNTSCCGEFRSPPAVRELAMQRQPTPRKDTSNRNRENHFYSRDDAIRLYSDSPAALTNLDDLPSKKIADSDADDKKARDSRDANINRSLQLKSWDAKKVRLTVTCYNCGKPRCLFSKQKDAEYIEAAKVLEQKLESIDFRYSCGDLIFEDDHPVGKIITQRQQLTCESKVEKAYYNHNERALKVEDVCIHCGEEGGSDFLLRQAQLESRNMTGGKQCFPICLDCIENKGKKPICYPKKKTSKTQKRKETQANKAAAQKEHIAKKSKK